MKKTITNPKPQTGEQSFHTKLENLLKTDQRFLDKEDELLKDAVIDAAYKSDLGLIELLLDQADAKKKFFMEMKGSWIFNANVFISYIQDKHFLNDSYTSFKNKIGITIDGKFLNERKEVALVWPFKDCVLEGGMRKEDQQRKEIFFNQILAQDEIDKLFAPKVFTNWKRYSPDGEKAVHDIKRDSNEIITENLIVKGNNLLALRSLEKNFKHKIKFVYIDPPYNTGSDSFGYNDNFSRSTWLTFMKNRLEAARELMLKDGVIAVQCSFHHHAYLKVMMDEIFPKHLMTLNIQVRHPDRILTGDKEYNDVIEYILLYGASTEVMLPVRKEKKTDDDYVYAIEEIGEGEEIVLGGKKVKVFTPDRYRMTEHGAGKHLFKTTSIRGSIREKNSSGRFYVKYLEPLRAKYPANTLFRVPDMGDDAFGDRYFNLPKDGNKNGGYFQGMPQSSDVTNKPYPNFFNFEKEYNNVSKQGGVNFRNGKKPEELLQLLMNLFTVEGSIVLDYHLGSGTTAAVAHKLGRQYIGIEQMDYGSDDPVARLKNVIDGDRSGISESIDWKGGGNFIYCELMKYNETFLEDIEAAKDTKSLMKVWVEMKKKSFFNFNVDLKSFEENLAEFEKLSLPEQKETLCSVLNKNQLYVNLTEISDADFKVGKEDMGLNRQFYRS